MRAREVERTPRLLVAPRARLGRDERKRRRDAFVQVRNARRRAGRERELGGVAEVERVRAEDERAAARGRLDQVLSAERREAAAEERDVGERVPGRHLEHRVAEPDVDVGRVRGRLVVAPRAPARHRQARRDDHRRDRVEALRMARDDDEQGTRRGALAPRGEERLLLAFARRRGEDDAARERRAPRPAAREQVRIGREVVLQVADDAHVAHARVAQARRVGIGLRERGGEARECRPQQRIDARAAAPAARAQARVGEQHRHAAPGGGGEQVGPDLGLHQHAGGRRDAMQESIDGAGRVERQPELAVAVAEQCARRRRVRSRFRGSG